MLAGALHHHLMNSVNEWLAVAREQLDSLFRCLVGTEESVVLIVTASVDGRGHDVIETADLFRSCSQKAAFASRSGVDVTADHIVRIL